MGAIQRGRQDEGIRARGSEQGLSPAAIESLVAQTGQESRAGLANRLTEAGLTMDREGRAAALQKALGMGQFALGAGRLDLDVQAAQAADRRFGLGLEEQISAREASEALARERMGIQAGQFDRSFALKTLESEFNRDLTREQVDFDRELQQRGLDAYMDEKAYQDKLRQYVMHKQLPEYFTNPFLSPTERSAFGFPGAGASSARFGFGGGPGLVRG
jgi:hypothetical protein